MFIMVLALCGQAAGEGRGARWRGGRGHQWRAATSGARQSLSSERRDRIVTSHRSAPRRYHELTRDIADINPSIPLDSPGYFSEL
ncbi:unnamed protein product [Colias eurytheme]|nr:unnamed protein product [Colias eurytheme]